MRLKALQGGQIARIVRSARGVDLLGKAALVLVGFWLGFLFVEEGGPSAHPGGGTEGGALAPPVTTGVAGLKSCPPYDTASAAPPPSYDSELAMSHLRMLAETIGPRPAGSAEELQAARYLHGYLAGLGYRTRIQGPIAVTAGKGQGARGKGEQRTAATATANRRDAENTENAENGGQRGQSPGLPEGEASAPPEERYTRNVVAFGPSCAPPGPALLIGAHYDSIALNGPCPAANDNGSGVAAMLEIARIAADLPLPCPLYFVAFGGEEMVDHDREHHHYGSRYFHAHQAQPLAAMLSIDMIGVGEQLHLRYLEPAPKPLLALLESAASRVGVAVSRKPDPGHSDHEPFARAGLPAVWIQRLPDPANHSSADTADRVNPAYIRSVVSLVTEFLTNLTYEDLTAEAGG